MGDRERTVRTKEDKREEEIVPIFVKVPCSKLNLLHMPPDLRTQVTHADQPSARKLHMVEEKKAMTDKRVDRTLKCNHERASGPPTTQAQQQTGTEEGRARRRATTGGQEGTNWRHNQATTGHRRSRKVHDVPKPGTRELKGNAQARRATRTKPCHHHRRDCQKGGTHFDRANSRENPHGRGGRSHDRQESRQDPQVQTRTRHGDTAKPRHEWDVPKPSPQELEGEYTVLRKTFNPRNQPLKNTCSRGSAQNTDTDGWKPK